MGVILFDGTAQQTLLPLTFTRPVADLRIGMLTVAEKWKKHFHQDASFITQKYLQTKFPLQIHHENLLIDGSVCPDEQLVEAIQNLRKGESLKQNDFLIAAKVYTDDVENYNTVIASFKSINYT
ncbi:MAG: glucose-1-phosphate thymidylyltransferase, partial [Sphingobacteriaceae bacterium]